MTRLVQISNGRERKVALVEEPRLRVLRDSQSVYALANAALGGHESLAQLVRKRVTDESLDYDAIYRDQSDWKLLCPFDHPDEPARCLVSGTGLTHLGSARDRQAMHVGSGDEALTDSMRMFRWGLEGGKPQPGQIGIAPEWFYKGCGTVLRAHNQPLDLPPYAEDGGEEAEIAGLYLIGPDGVPYRVGMSIGNEFSDHRFEKKNYLNLAGSKLRTCALGPEIAIDPEFQTVPGKVEIERGGEIVWSKTIRTGQAEMCHSLANIEHHHFKFEGHRRPGDVHVHYYGAHSLSFGDGIALADGDVMRIEFEGFGRPLRNVLREIGAPDRLVAVKSFA
jgi:hypothetical protein